MALADPALPYGLRDVRLTPLSSTGVLGTPVDLPVGRTLSFSEAEEYEELRGDDHLVAIHGKGPQVEWNLESGGISLDAWAVLTGGTINESGSTPNQIKSFTKQFTDSRSYFQIEGQSVSDEGGDVHVIIKKAKCDGSLEGEFSDGSFFLTKCSGKGLADASDDLYVITWNETITAISDVNNELQEIIIDATGGNYTLTYSGQTTANIAATATAATIQAALIALSNIGPSEVVVAGAVGGPFTVEFKGTLGDINVAQMTATDVSLSGGSTMVAVRTIRQGG